MFPRTALLDEFREARGVVKTCLENIRHQGIPCHSCPQIERMVELPSVLKPPANFHENPTFFPLAPMTLYSTCGPRQR